ncbi:uncharacterized protein LOC126670307 [Mercurialis annua]|uniref:uncharacterized protein LOC126670307 n=1 Tax=Mercurialis annua TaxID=3986 RepID=UPI002160E1F2|nr:uncharacterized protein LOC126670307 [Mercurialis annua]
MAPKKRKSEGTDDAVAKPVRAVAATTRVTRSSALKNRSPAVAALELPKRKKGKAAAEAKKIKAEVKAETESKNVEEKNDVADGKEEADEDETADDESNNKTIVVEHCKQCNSFKTRAVQVKKGLESAVPGINVVLNPDQPRKGCFEIREEGGETFISLQDMTRPFKPMKDLDMEKVISDVIEKIK